MEGGREWTVPERGVTFGREVPRGFLEYPSVPPSPAPLKGYQMLGRVG